MEESSYDNSFARSWSPMAAAYRQVKGEALEYAKTVNEDPDYIQARASIIAEQAFGLLSKRIKESETYDEVLATVFLGSARSEFMSLIGKFQEDIAAILTERAQLKTQSQIPIPDTPSTASSTQGDISSETYSPSPPDPPKRTNTPT